MTRSNDIAYAFHEWERKLRGWDVYDHPVVLEPPLIPLFSYLPDGFKQDSGDDGREHTLLSSLSEGITEFFVPKQQTQHTDDSYYYEYSDIPEEFLKPRSAFAVFHVALPSDHTNALTTYRNFLQSLRYCNLPLSFEVVSSQNQTVVQIGTWEPQKEKLLSQLRAHLSEATITEEQDAIDSHIRPDKTLVIDFGLEHEVMHPLNLITDLKHDPLRAIVGGMEELLKGEYCTFQVLFTHTNQNWETALSEAVVDQEGKSLFSDAPELLQHTKTKISSPIYSCVIRVAIVADSNERLWELAKRIGGGLAQFDAPGINNLMPLTNDNYDDHWHWRDVQERTSHRSGMLLSLNELVGLVHYPDAIVKSEKLLRQRIKTKAAPDLAVGNELILGLNEHRGVAKEVSLSDEQRSRHMYVVGSSGTGKSTLLLNCIRQDIQNGHGVCVIDPHGDLIDQALTYIPDERIKDVILLDPSDENYPIGFNILHAHSNLEKTLLASDLVAVFERLSTTWGDQMNAVLSNGILAFLESTTGGTLMDLRRFLAEKDFRSDFLETVTDEEVVYFWKHEFPMLSAKPQAPVLTRLNTFLRPKPIRNMVSQKNSAIDFADVMDNGKILLAKLSHGGIGEENAYLLGALIASKIHQTALSRQAISQEKRRFFWLYIDEFQNFVVPSIDQTLSGARKYHLGMVLAHQELTQLTTQNKAIAASVIANPYTRICFRMGDRDARTLSEGFSEFDSKDLQSLGIGEAIGRIEQAKYDFSLSTYPLPDINDKEIEYKVNAIKETSRAKYATPLTSVAKENVQSPRQESLVKEKSSQPETTISKTENIKGKGGEEHKEIQNLLQKTSHDLGFGAVVEHHIGNGQHIDVVIDTGKRKIACEISVSTNIEHEMKNIQKCIDAGFQNIWIITESKKQTQAIQDQWNQLQEYGILQNVRFFVFNNALSELLKIPRNINNQMIRGYALQHEHEELDDDEIQQRETLISRLMSKL